MKTLVLSTLLLCAWILYAILYRPDDTWFIFVSAIVLLILVKAAVDVGCKIEKQDE